MTLLLFASLGIIIILILLYLFISSQNRQEPPAAARKGVSTKKERPRKTDDIKLAEKDPHATAAMQKKDLPATSEVYDVGTFDIHGELRRFL